MKKVFTLLLTGTVFFSAHAQSFVCGTTQKSKEALKENPSIIESEQALEAFIKQFAAQAQQSSAARECPIIIPIVFHILHDFGRENISDAQIYDQVRILNEDFNKRNADTSDVVSVFKDIIADVGIEFRLARIDPNGNPTNGIDRIACKQTFNGTDPAKINPWPRENYLNVWVANTMENGVAGYAFLPGTVAGFWTDRDGIMILHNYIGSIGTGSVYGSRALTHEIGHYLNLQHVWGGSNEPGVACGDDGVDDTPITKGSNLACNKNLNECELGVIENVQNYMDYSYCSRMFTEGQKTRMLATLNSMVASRRNLWTCENLTATGVNDPYDWDDSASPPIAAFGTLRSYACFGDPIKFIDASYNGRVDTRFWETDDMDADIVTSNNDSIATISFYTPGWKTVRFTVENGYGTSTAVDSFAVYISEGLVYHDAPFFEDFERPESFEEWNVINYNGTKSYFQPTNVASRSGNHCFMVNNYKKTRQSDVEELISPTLDLSGITDFTFSFYYSLASANEHYSDNSIDTFRVYASIDCGKTWLALYKSGGPTLVNGGYLLSNFAPSAGFYWRKLSFTMSQNVKNPNVVFKIQYKSSELSNNLYVDDINIAGADVSLGIEDAKLDNGALKVYPNPSNGAATIAISTTKAEDGTLEVFDVSGKLISTIYEGLINEGDNRIDLNESVFPAAGVYFVKLKTASGVYGSKVVITR